jgi:hypothetical protein
MRRVLVLPAAVLLATVAVGCSGRSASPPDAATEMATTAPLSPEAAVEGALTGLAAGEGGSGPTTVVDGVAMGYRPDAEGAEAAAREFVRVTASMVAMEPAPAMAAQRVIAASASEEELVLTRSAELQNIWGSSARDELSYWFTPIASRAQLVGDGEALAEVWYVGVLRSPLLPGMQSWRTATYRLVWEDEDWRISEESEVAGPVPTLPLSETPTSSAEMDALLEGFDPRG